MKSILFRADGNERIGVGHIMRCCSVADAFSEEGYKCIFAISDKEMEETIQRRGYVAINLNVDYRSLDDEKEGITTHIQEIKPYAVVIDSYFATDGYVRRVHEACHRYGGVCVIFDDFLQNAYPCDYLIHYAIDGESKKEELETLYRKEGFIIPELMLGVKYTPLRRDYSKERKVRKNKNLSKIIITTGGSDGGHFMLKILQYMLNNTSSDKGYRYHLIIGGLNADENEIIKMAERTNSVEIYRNVDNIYPIISESDIAISTGGTTLLELCACGVPTIAFSCADNQIDGTIALSKRCGILYLGDIRFNNDLIKKVFETIEEIAADNNLRFIMSEKERNSVDGLGAVRIVNNILGGKHE